MSADAGGVRLNEWRELSRQTGFGVYRVELVVPHHDATAPDLVAWPAAQAAAMLAALEEAQAYIDSGVVDVARAVGISNRITAALSTLPRAHGGEGGGA